MSNRRQGKQLTVHGGPPTRKAKKYASPFPLTPPKPALTERP